MDSGFLNDLIVLLNAFGVGNCFVLSIVFARNYQGRSDKHEIWISALLFILGMVTLNTIINKTGYVELFPKYEAFSNAVGYAIAPLLYLVVRSLKVHQSNKLVWPHLWLSIFILLVTAADNFITADFWLKNALAVFTQDSLFKIIWNVHFAVYVFLAFLQLPKTSSKNDEKLVLTLFWGISLIWFINLLGFVFEEVLFPNVVFLRLNITVLFFCLTLYIFYNKLFFPKTQRKFSKKTALGSTTDSLNQMEFKSIMNQIVEEKLYRKPDLSVRSLSEDLGISYTSLSQIINQETGANFNDFINGLRIDEIITFLKSDAQKDFTILGLAQQVGFRSASSFYAAFRKTTGTTPTVYLELLHNN